MIDFLIYFSAILGPFWVVLICNQLVNNPKYALWIRYEFFNRQPFNCLKCLSFWSNIIIWIGLTITFKDLQISIPYLVSTFLWTILFMYEERNNKF